jgi:hypothetical protein
MLKKSLIALVVLAIAMPAMAGDLKIHGNWPCSYVAQQVAQVNVLLNVGYYIHVVNQKPFYVDQDTTAGDPYHTYVGCFVSQVDTNFEAKITVSIKGDGPSNGKVGKNSTKWSITSGNNTVIPLGGGQLTVCVKAENLAIQNLVGGSKDNVVAILTINAVPTAACAACND